MKEDPFWEQALSELNAGQQDADLWSRCLAENKGNAAFAEMQYLRDRSKQLAEAQRQEEQRTQQKTEDAHLSQAMRIVQALPKGKCPSCQAVILLSAQACPKCLVSFAPGSGRKIAPIDATRR